MKNKLPIPGLLLLLIFIINFSICFSQNCDYARKLFEKADYMTNRDSAFLIFQEAKPLLFGCQSWDTLLNTYNNEFHYHYNTDNFSGAQQSLENGRKLIGKPKGNYMSEVFFHNNVGLLNLWDGNLQDAFIEFKKAINQYENIDHPNRDFIFTLYNNLGITYNQMGDFKLASFHYQEALNLIIAKKVFADSALTNSNRLRQGKLYKNIAEYHRFFGEHESANQVLNQALQVIKPPFTNNREAFYYGNFLLSLATNFQNLQQLDSSQFYLKKSQRYLTSNLQQADYLVIAGWNYFHKKNYSKARQTFQKSLPIFVKNYGKKHPAVAQIYQAIGNCYQKENKWQQALNEYQKAINALLESDFEITEIKTLPFTYQVKAKSDFIEILKEKCIALNHLSANKVDSLQNLKIALQHYQYITQLSDQLRQNYQTEEAKIFLSAESNTYFEKAIGVAKNLYDLTADEVYLETAFFFSEKSKALVLLDEIKLKEVAGLSILPDSILQHQQQLKTTINELEQLLAIEKRKETPAAAQIADYENKLLTATQQQMKLNESIKKQFPTYQSLTQIQPISVEQIRKDLLQNQQTLLEYFVGKDQIYLFIIANRRLELLAIKKDFDLPQKLQTLINNRKITELEYAENAYYLYQKLVQIGNFPTQEKLIIIPDGSLAFLPFEMLLTNSSEVQLPKKMPWLLKKHACSYAFSATILTLQNQQKIENAQVLAIAPIFKDSQKELGCSQKELALFENLSHQKLIEQQATSTNFRQLASQFEVLHFCTHASSSDTATLQPSISFFDDKIHLADLYSLRLNAHLAVLSACETGIGNLQKGEGVMSLSRGLSYAGVPSLVTTLWAVNDQTTATLMRLFYENLQAGMDKSVALQQAKLGYLATAPQDLATPYYWAAPILVGNYQPISFTKNNHRKWSLLFGLASVFGIGILLGYWKIKRKIPHSILH